MSQLPLSLYTSEQLQQLDVMAQEALPQQNLMEIAGEAAFRSLQTYWPNAKKILFFCGQGNNGGDGYVVARLAKERGLDVRIIAVGEKTPTQGDVFSAYEKARKANVSITLFEASLTLNIHEYDLVVDALLGTGLKGTVRELYTLVIQQINHAHAPVLSIDIPSGLSADTGHALGSAVKADITITFIGLKQGLFTGEGPAFAGKICYSDLNIPDFLLKKIPANVLRLDWLPWINLLTPRPADAHKGIFGHVVIVGGQPGMPGSVRMAGEAALRVGAGRVTILTHPSHAPYLNCGCPEIICYGVDSINHAIKNVLESATIIVLGPGLGQSRWANHLFDAVLEMTCPIIIDADGLNILAQRHHHRTNWILTPHPGEARRLLTDTTDTVRNDRFKAVNLLQSRFGGVAILKGAGTLIKSDTQSTYLCSAGNPGMATAGMGDILSGIIAGLVAQGVSLADSACLGVYLHALAGDEVAAEYGQRGMKATDLLPYLHALVNGIRTEKKI